MNPDALDHPHEKERDDHESASVADKGHGQPDHGQNAQIHACILKSVRKKHRDDANNQQSPNLVA